MSDADYRIEAVRRRDQRIAALNGMPEPKQPGVLTEIAEEIGDIVKETTAKVATKTERAMQWLAERLKDGPVAQKEIESDGLKHDFGLKLLKEAKKRLRVGSLRKGHSWFWVGKSPEAD